MTQPLSPAAQAVLHAFWDAPVSPSRNVQVAAALRTLADQALPASSPLDRGTWSPFAAQIRAEILAIAAELDGGS